MAALRGSTLVSNAPTPRIKAVKAGSNTPISILPDSGATMNIACKDSCALWGLEIMPLGEGEASLTDVQGRAIPLVGKATIALTLPGRGLDISLDIVVSDTLGLSDLIVGWQ